MQILNGDVVSVDGVDNCLFSMVIEPCSLRDNSPFELTVSEINESNSVSCKSDIAHKDEGGKETQ